MSVDKIKEIVKELKDKHKLEIMILSDEESPCTINEYISTGCLALDYIMGGGLPVGRMVEIYGDPSSGKSLVGAQIAAVAQEAGYIVEYIDTESAVSKDMMKILGVDIDSLIYTVPDTMEDVFESMEKTIDIASEKDPDNITVIIWDSIAATSSEAEMGKAYGEVGYLDHARIMSQALRKFMRKVSKKRVAVLFLNQTREKLGVMFGDKTATFGGKAVSFHASVRVHLNLSSKIKIPGKKKSKIVGMNTNAVCTKNKVAIPFREAILPIYFGHGIDDALASFQWLEDNGFITGSTWKVLDLQDDKEEVRFQKAGWSKIYEENYDDISKVILEDTNIEIGSYEEEEVDEQST